MKKLILMAFALGFIALSAQSQLADTKWKSSMNIPNPVECLLQFKKDTLIVLVAADPSMVVETMTYKLKNDTLTIYKVSGTSPCTDTPGLYKWVLKDEKLFITPLSDECEDRANAFTPEGWIKEK